MSATQAVAAVSAKLAVVFGTGAAITANYRKDEVVYTDGKTSLAFTLTDDTRKDAGQYDVTVVSDTELTEVRSATQPAAETKAAASKPAAKQSPSFGYGVKAPR